MKFARGAKVFVRRASDGKYLVLTGSVWPERPDRSQKPDLPGGLVEAGETHTKGLVRELQEETGIVVAESDLVEVYHRNLIMPSRLARLDLRVYVLDVVVDTISISWEHESYRWCSREELGRLDIRQPYRHLIEKLLKKGTL